METSVETPDLQHLRTVFDRAVTTLGAVGADGYRDLVVSVSGWSRGAPVCDLSVDRRGLSVTPPSGACACGRSAADGCFESAHAALVIGFLHLLRAWEWESRRAMRYLGIGPATIDVWLLRVGRQEAPDLAPRVTLRLRRLAVIEQMRMLAGVSDDEVRDWLREPNPALGGRAALSVLTNDGDPGYHRVMHWLLDQVVVETVTVH